MKSLLPLQVVASLFLLSLVRFSVAQTTEPVFGGVAEITVPAGASLLESGFRGGRSYEVVLDSGSGSVILVAERLPAKRQGWSDARWAKSELSYYRNGKNKREYRFRQLKTSTEGNTFSVEVQFTLKDGAKRRTLRLQERMVRVDSVTVIKAQFVTDKPGSWNNSDSVALRNAVASLRQASSP